ncbi:MAG TPA: 2'-5' RNA ligase family protein, partial [Vicinamibacteria bacterium]|nr:2'-5' RNA ligase family protein [Vicinamibacteria bacterium]
QRDAEATAPSPRVNPGSVGRVGEETDPETGLPLTGPGSFARIADARDLKPGDLISDPTDTSKPPRILTVAGEPQFVPGLGPRGTPGHVNVPVEGEDRPRRLLEGSRIRVVKPEDENAPPGWSIQDLDDALREQDTSLAEMLQFSRPRLEEALRDAERDGVGAVKPPGGYEITLPAEVLRAVLGEPNAPSPKKPKGPPEDAERDAAIENDTTLGHLWNVADDGSVSGTVDGGIATVTRNPDGSFTASLTAQKFAEDEGELSYTEDVTYPRGTSWADALDQAAGGVEPLWEQADALDLFGEGQTNSDEEAAAEATNSDELDALAPEDMSDEQLEDAMALAIEAGDEDRLTQLEAEQDARGLNLGFEDESVDDELEEQETLFSDADVEGQPSAEVPAEVQAALDGIKVGGSPGGTGTKDDPIDVGGDIEAAVQHLAAGRHVRLRQPDEVATLLDRLSAYVAEAKAKGEDAPNFDLCGVTVPGTNLFCVESKGIPRASMPQLSGTPAPNSPAAAKMKPGDTEANITDDFRKALEGMGVNVERKTVLASHLRASQAELDGPKVAGMSRAMGEGKIPDKPIFVTRDGYIIDGHHRWAAKVALDLQDNQLGDVSMPVDVLDMDIGAALDFANDFALGMGIRPKGLGTAAEGVVGEGETLIAPGQIVSTPTKALVGSCLVWSDGLRAEVKAQQDAGEALLETKAGGIDRNRGHAERLRRYWSHGEGAAKIGWGTHGDFYRCVSELSKYLGARAKGYCNLRHQEAVGAPPGKGHGKYLTITPAHKALLDSLGIAGRLGLEDKAEALPNENPEPNGVMVALYPSDDVAHALALDVEGAEAATELHVTLAYLGKADELDDPAGLVDLVARLAADTTEVEAGVAGLGRWEAGDDGDAFVALVDSPALPGLRAGVVAELAAAGFDASDEHGFTPHITLAYLDPGAESPLERLATIPATFEFLSVAVGPDVWDFPLNRP